MDLADDRYWGVATHYHLYATRFPTSATHACLPFYSEHVECRSDPRTDAVCDSRYNCVLDGSRLSRASKPGAGSSTVSNRRSQELELAKGINSALHDSCTGECEGRGEYNRAYACLASRSSCVGLYNGTATKLYMGGSW